MPRAPKASDSREGRTVPRRPDVAPVTWIGTTAGKSHSIGTAIAAAVLLCAVGAGGWGCAARTPSLRAECPSLDAVDYYFPKGALDPARAKVDNVLRDWYSQYLRAMLEPSLSCGQPAGGYAYRFLWLRSFHRPIAVRIEEDGSSATLSMVELDGTGGRGPGNIVRRTSRALSPAEQSKFLTQLNRVGFWEMKKNQDRFGMEGAQWVLEGTEKGQYQIVDRWSPGPGAYRDACLTLLEIAGVSIPRAELY
ncbi:MAG: hypothetical protein MUC88_02035 [Planctomycetes bacterium]|nr:hypothetical protein [Planctomycetota bacterium]